MHTVTMKIRPAIAGDFTTRNGGKKTGVLYFEKSAHGHIQPYAKVLDEDTNLITFKELFNCCQIFVPENFFDEMEIK